MRRSNLTRIRCKALRPLQQITINIAGREHTAADPLADTARAILESIATTAPSH